jgi:tetratricopeptide (TPR) repeat protein
MLAMEATCFVLATHRPTTTMLTTTGEESDDITNEFFMNQVKEAEQLHDRGIDLCYVSHDYDKALDVLYKAAHLRESLLGKYHADTALTYFRIASILSEYKANYHDALRMARRELRLSHRLLGEIKPANGKDKNYLISSKYMREQSWLMERLACFKAVLLNVHDMKGEEKNKYRQNLLRSISMEQLGDKHVASKDWEKALTYFNNAMALECHAYARNLLDTADLQVKMSVCLVGMNDAESAIDELKHATRKYRQVLWTDLGRSQTAKRGDDQQSLFPHSVVGDIHSQIAAIYLSQRKFDDALGEYAKAFSMFEECLGKSNVRSVRALSDMKVVTVEEMDYSRKNERGRLNESKRRI